MLKLEISSDMLKLEISSQKNRNWKSPVRKIETEIFGRKKKLAIESEISTLEISSENANAQQVWWDNQRHATNFQVDISVRLLDPARKNRLIVGRCWRKANARKI